MEAALSDIVVGGSILSEDTWLRGAGCANNKRTMLDCVLIACVRRGFGTRVLLDYWTDCICVGRSLQNYVGHCVVGTAVVECIGSWERVNDREGRCAFGCGG